MTASSAYNDVKSFSEVIYMQDVLGHWHTLLPSDYVKWNRLVAILSFLKKHILLLKDCT